MNRNFMVFSILMAALLIFASALVFAATIKSAQAAPNAPSAQSMGNGFTYQGVLKRAGTPVTATCNFQFTMWDAESGGNQYNDGQAVTLAVQNGLFTAVLNTNNEFVGAIDGVQRWIQTAVQCPGDATFTTLSRQAILAVPYAAGLVPGAGVTGNVENAAIFGVYNGSQGANAVGLSGNSGTGVGVSGTTFSGQAGVRGDGGSDGSAGVYGYSKKGKGVVAVSEDGTGLNAYSTNGFGISASHVTQNLPAGGFVKFALRVYIDDNKQPQIAECFNSQSTLSITQDKQPGCGFTISKTNVGRYLLKFSQLPGVIPHDMDARFRFFSATALNQFVTVSVIPTVNFNEVQVHTGHYSNTGEYVDEPFYLVVY